MQDMSVLTARQKDVYLFIKDLICNRGYGPTVREIGEHFEINSPNGVVCHLRALETKGFINRGKMKSRAITLVDEEATTSGLPFVGTVAAGPTTLAFEQDERIDFGEMFTDESNFVLKVSGDSMIDAHIEDGDFVVVKRQKTARKGQIVVAETDNGEATLKYWFPEGNRVRLQPANDSLDPIYLKDVNVLGVVAGVIRKV